MHDYERIAAIIRYLDQHHVEQPDLHALAREAGLSTFHLHRLFSAWAGITPKDFVQCLTLNHVKQLLASGQSVLDAALNVGLSGPGRLHDLCINLEAASPGEIKAGGRDWTIVAGFAASPFGRCLIGESPRGICHLSFVDGAEGQNRSSTPPVEEKRAWDRLQGEWPNASLARDDATAAALADRIFARPDPEHTEPRLKVFLKGSAFQLRVWRALVQIPAGRLVTYGQLGASLNCPTAARAVGNAVGQNPVAYLIPCHRVIRATGILGGYRWGPERKRALVALETSGRRTAQAVG